MKIKFFFRYLILGEIGSSSFENSVCKHWYSLGTPCGPLAPAGPFSPRYVSRSGYYFQVFQTSSQIATFGQRNRLTGICCLRSLSINQHNENNTALLAQDHSKPLRNSVSAAEEPSDGESSPLFLASLALWGWFLKWMTKYTLDPRDSLELPTKAWDEKGCGSEHDQIADPEICSFQWNSANSKTWKWSLKR